MKLLSKIQLAASALALPFAGTATVADCDKPFEKEFRYMSAAGTKTLSNT